tara:strand:- start:566 stop:2173 length:1608 start_codon:yes stop_codon:yes gene_type:complete
MWTESDLRGAIPIYLLEILWAGRTHRFSTFPVHLTTDGGDSIPFLGELEDVDYSDSANRSGVSDSGPSISLDVVFPVDVAKEYADQHPLDEATGELSLVFVQPDGTINQTYENRFILSSGYVEMPGYAFPGADPGLASFTLEQPASDDGARIIPEAAVITKTTFPNAADTLGAVYPFVFGSPGTFVNSAGTANTKPATPAYLVSTDVLLIAGHEVVGAAAVTIFDADGNTTTATPTPARDGLARLVSTVDISGAGSPFDKTSSKFYVAWPSNSGGMIDPLIGGLLTRLGDLCVWALTQSTIGADIGKWRAAAPLLNGIKLAGFIDDPDLTPWSWLIDTVLRLIPLEVRQGPGGVFPLPRFLDRRISDVVAFVDAGADFTPAGQVQTISERIDLVNEVSLRWALDLAENTYRRRLTAQARVDSADPDTFSSPHAIFSQSRYGLRQKTITSSIVYDSGSAGAIIQQALRAGCYSTRTRTYLAAPRWGWLDIGHAIALTEADLSLTDRIVEIIGRQWTGNAWLFTVVFDEDPFREEAG